MNTVYIYALNTLADWEIAFLTAEINSRRFFKKDAESYKIKFTGPSMKEISTMGGIKILPEILVDEITIEEGDILILPGADTWNDEADKAILNKAKEFLNKGNMVAGICEATVAMANAGILDNRAHSSNGAGFLDMFAPFYRGKEFYKDCLAYTDGNLITGSGAGALYWTKLILAKMNVMKNTALEFWLEYFNTGKAQAFFSLMQALAEK